MTDRHHIDLRLVCNTDAWRDFVRSKESEIRAHARTPADADLLMARLLGEAPLLPMPTLEVERTPEVEPEPEALVECSVCGGTSFGKVFTRRSTSLVCNTCGAHARAMFGQLPRQP